MGDETLKDFTVNWVIGGLLMFSLVTFAVLFMADNNSIGLDDGSGNIFDQKYNDSYNELIELPEDVNYLLNITSSTNPEISDLGSRDSVSTAYSTRQNSLSNWENSKELLSWVFSGDSGKVLLGSIGGILAFLSMFFIWRFIRGF